MSKAARKVTPEEVWAGFDELRKSQQETDRQLQQTSLEIRESHKRTEDEFRKIQREMKESHRKVNETISKTNGKFDVRWGKFVERLVEGDLVKLLADWNIEVNRIQPRFVYPLPKSNRKREFDLVAINGEELVIVEAKSTLEKKDVDNFMRKLHIFKKAPPAEYKDKKLYGGVAYLEVIKKADEYADGQGLFVIKSLGGKTNSSIITNDPESFRPKNF